jgi:hypothetical protein
VLVLLETIHPIGNPQQKPMPLGHEQPQLGLKLSPPRQGPQHASLLSGAISFFSGESLSETSPVFTIVAPSSKSKATIMTNKSQMIVNAFFILQ